jgi:hypothetical protein
MLRATNVFTLALLEHNALIIGADVEPSLFNLLLMEPADQDLTSGVAHLLAWTKRSWPGSPWRDAGWSVAIKERRGGCGRLLRWSDFNGLAVGLLLRLLRDEV